MRIESVFKGAIKQDDHFAVAGMKLALKNFDTPTAADIVINPEVAELKTPQAWSQEIDGIVYWFYNFTGAETEAKYRGVSIPTLEEWHKIFAAIR